MLAVQLASPLHSWLESSAERLHHDGFVWSAALATQEPCHVHDCDDADPTGDREHDHANGHCHDRECHAGCTHISIQSVLHAALLETDFPPTSADLSFTSPILPGTHPETFLPPRA